jgi:hypothetical protein
MAVADAFGDGPGVGVAEGLADALSLGSGDGGAVPPLRETKALYFAAMRCCGVPAQPFSSASSVSQACVGSNRKVITSLAIGAAARAPNVPCSTTTAIA